MYKNFEFKAEINSEKQIYMDTIPENCNVNIASPGDMKIIIFSHLSDFIEVVKLFY